MIFNLSLEADLTLIPIINKIDSPQANIEKTEDELTALGFSKEEIIKVSAKTGENVEEVIKAIINKIPSPISKNQQLTSLIFDSSLDPFKGVIATIRFFGGKINKGDQVYLLATKTKAEVLQIGYLTPKPVQVENLSDGEVGYIITNIKDLSKVSLQFLV